MILGIREHNTLCDYTDTWVVARQKPNGMGLGLGGARLLLFCDPASQENNS